MSNMLGLGIMLDVWRLGIVSDMWGWRIVSNIWGLGMVSDMWGLEHSVEHRAGGIVRTCETCKKAPCM